MDRRVVPYYRKDKNVGYVDGFIRESPKEFREVKAAGKVIFKEVRKGEVKPAP